VLISISSAERDWAWGVRFPFGSPRLRLLKFSHSLAEVSQSCPDPMPYLPLDLARCGDPDGWADRVGPLRVLVWGTNDAV